MTPASPSKNTAAHAFLGGLIDYAGLFPPAALPLARAISNYAAFRRQGEAWLLGRFIIPAGQLPALSEFAYLFDPEFPFQFSVLGGGGGDTAAWLAQLLTDQIAIARCQQRHAPGVHVPVFEVRVPAELAAADPAPITTLLTKAAEDIPANQQPFYELPLPPTAPGWGEATQALCSAIAAFNATDPPQPAGFKLRCGGVSAELYPTPAQVALAIQAATAAGISFKATAGLHHPLRHFNEEAGTTMHGFLNVFGAALLARHNKLDEADLTTVIADENEANFSFDDGAFHWREHTIPAAALHALRQSSVRSFGSCNFNEPRADLHALGMLPSSGE